MILIKKLFLLIFVFFIFCSLSIAANKDIMVAPVPWVPEDNKADTGTITDGITFINLPQESDIKIYTISGDLVKVIDTEDVADISSGVSWFGKNDAGEKVVSGIYIWVVESNEGMRAGKLIILW